MFSFLKLELIYSLAKDHFSVTDNEGELHVNNLCLNAWAIFMVN